MTSNDFQQAATFIRDNLTQVNAPGELDHLKFTAALKRHGQKKLRNRKLGITAAVTLCALVGIATASSLKTQVLTYHVGGSSENGAVGSYVSAPNGNPLDIHFSEGSDVVLEPNARGRIAQTTSAGATVVLEDGRAHANIVHRRGTAWQILAGPYVVGVTGTSFDVAFHVATQTFELDMRSGSVRVMGPGLKEPIEIRDQQRITLSMPSRRTSVPAVAATEIIETPAVADPSATGSSAACPASVVPPTTGSRTKRSATGNAGAETRTPALESFTQLGAKGQHARIVALAEETGLSTITAQLNASDLMALGNAARFVGKSAVASKAYRAIRERFGRSSESAPAAFFMGRLAEARDPTSAMSWYDKYVTEAPNGVWIAEAKGRRLVLTHQLQGKEASLVAAQEYLERFPSGPYAGFARKLLSL